ncbi:MAG: extracellular solute-binding protein [Deltaproteobacteria bacterium]|nr:extracellular solute-binding protein [Deltaproteobacteria bacterium]
MNTKTTPRLTWLAACVLALIFAGCEKKSAEVVIYTSVDQVFSEPVLKDFEKETGIKVRMVFDTEETKSTGLLNRLLAESAHPQADVFWSNDPVRSQVLVRRELVEPYVPSTSVDIPASFKDPKGRWVAFSARARVILLNKKRLGDGPKPTGVKDLLDPRWRGQATIANPAFGTTTMHLAALFNAWGEAKTRKFLKGLRENQIRMASSNGEVKRLVSTGEMLWGLTDTDDAAVAIKSGAPVEVIYPDEKGMGTLLMPTTAVLIRGGPHMAQGKKLLDYLASKETERKLAFAPCAQLPLREDVPTPAHLRKAKTFTVMQVDYEKIATVMEKIHPMLRDWAEGKPIETTSQAVE